MTTVLAAFVLGSLFNFFGVSHNPQRIGPILAGIGFFAYSAAALSFFLAGKHYMAFKRNLKYRSFFVRKRSKRGYDKQGFKPWSDKMDYGDPVSKPSMKPA